MYNVRKAQRYGGGWGKGGVAVAMQGKLNDIGVAE